MRLLLTRRLLALGAIVTLLAVGVVSTSSSRATLTPPAVSAAQVDYFLKLDGVEGESTDDRHKGEIDIESFSWGVSNQGSFAGGGGGGAGKATFQDFHFTKVIDKSSPILMVNTASGKHMKEAILIGMNQNGEKFLEIKLTDVLITSYQQSGDTGGPPQDQFSLNFAKIEYSYFPQGPDGQTEAPVKGGWDLKANKKV